MQVILFFFLSVSLFVLPAQAQETPRVFASHVDTRLEIIPGFERAEPEFPLIPYSAADVQAVHPTQARYKKIVEPYKHVVSEDDLHQFIQGLSRAEDVDSAGYEVTPDGATQLHVHHRQRVKLFGFIPVWLKTHVEIRPISSSSFHIYVNQPWWASLTTGRSYVSRDILSLLLGDDVVLFGTLRLAPIAAQAAAIDRVIFLMREAAKPYLEISL